VVLSGNGVATLHEFNGNNDNNGCLAICGAARKIVMEVPLHADRDGNFQVYFVMSNDNYLNSFTVDECGY
jgi:hypothetical protein